MDNMQKRDGQIARERTPKAETDFQSSYDYKFHVTALVALLNYDQSSRPLPGSYTFALALRSHFACMFYTGSLRE